MIYLKRERKKTLGDLMSVYAIALNLACVLYSNICRNGMCVYVLYTGNWKRPKEQ